MTDFPLFDSTHSRHSVLFVNVFCVRTYVQDMMINPYANFVIQKMVVTAEERQVRLLLEVASSNAASLARYAHGRHVIDAMERFLGGAKAVVHADPAALPCRRR